MENRFQTYLTKQSKFSINIIFTRWMTGLPYSAKTIIAKTLGKENIKNVTSVRVLLVDIIEIIKKKIMDSNTLTNYGLVSNTKGTNYIQ